MRPSDDELRALREGVERTMTHEEMAQVLESLAARARIEQEDAEHEGRTGAAEKHTAREVACEAGAAALRAVDTQVGQRAINIARGCLDYQGGYHGENLDVFHHGIGTVVRCLEEAAAGDNSFQLRVVESIGRELPAPPEGV